MSKVKRYVFVLPVCCSKTFNFAFHRNFRQGQSRDVCVVSVRACFFVGGFAKGSRLCFTESCHPAKDDMSECRRKLQTMMPLQVSRQDELPGTRQLERAAGAPQPADRQKVNAGPTAATCQGSRHVRRRTILLAIFNRHRHTMDGARTQGGQEGHGMRHKLNS